MPLNRRQFIAVSGSLLLPACAATQPAPLPQVLRAGVSRQQLVPEQYPQTEVWSYDGRVPGPLLRAKQGERLRVLLANALPQASTVHWHGIRLPNAMDGVPHLTQKPVLPGGEFLYEFTLPDAGTYWYHPHERSQEQVARGLYGALIVDEPQPPEVDRDETWVLSDWRLDKTATDVADFDSNRFDLSHGGRIGNTVTINGRFTPIGGEFALRSGERIRLRLINAAIKDREIAARGESDAGEVGEPEILQIMGKMVKQRQESARAYEEGGRLELAEKELAEIRVIQEFLPRQMDQGEVAAAVNAAVAETGAASIRDVGRVMAALKARHAGQMDFGAVGALVKARLG